MRIAVAADERVGVADAVVEELRRRGHEPVAHGALADDERDDWAWASEAAARDVADGRADQAVVCCWTGTGASIAANKVGGHPRRAVRRRAPRPRARAGGTTRTCSRSACARRPRPSWREILDAWFAGEPSAEADDVANVEHLERHLADAATASRPVRDDAGRPARSARLRRRAHDERPTRSRTSLSRSTARRRSTGARADRQRHRHGHARRPAPHLRRADDRGRDDARGALRAQSPTPRNARAASSAGWRPTR